MMKKYLQAALVADALSLGPHWIYNQAKIARIYPNGVTQFTDPASQYHPGKKAGDLTHYGQQALILAKSIEQHGEFDEERWREDWLAAMASFTGYVDGAAKETIASDGLTASSSNDLGGASRIAPILDLDLNLAEKIAAARAQTALTHGDPSVIDSAEFFVRAVVAIEEGAEIKTALETAAKEGNYNALDGTKELENAHSQSNDYLAAASSLGLTCHFPEAFPLTLYFALRPGADFSSIMNENALAGGDNSARAMLLALIFAARDKQVGVALAEGLNLSPNKFEAGSNSVSLEYDGNKLAGVLEMPEEGVDVIATAIFAHCFTCGKDFLPGARVSRGLASRGIATLRIDFTGLGKSSGEFSESSFITNVNDLLYAGQWLSEALMRPSLLVGHSLGGASVLAAADKINGVKAVSTIGAPADPGHVTHMFESAIDTIKKEGSAEVSLAGRTFKIGERFLSDLQDHDQIKTLKGLKNIDVLIMHAPDDTVVGIHNAGEIYSALHHPKSFISLAGADHLLTDAKDAEYVAELIRTWASRVLE